MKIATIMTITAFFCMSKNAYADIRKELLVSQLNVCTELANFGVEMVDWKQGNLYPSFRDVRASLDGEGIVNRTTLFLLALTEGHFVVQNAANLESWKSEVYRLGVEFCQNETDF